MGNQWTLEEIRKQHKIWYDLDYETALEENAIIKFYDMKSGEVAFEKGNHSRYVSIKTNDKNQIKRALSFIFGSEKILDLDPSGYLDPANWPKDLQITQIKGIIAPFFNVFYCPDKYTEETIITWVGGLLDCPDEITFYVGEISSIRNKETRRAVVSIIINGGELSSFGEDFI